MIELTHSKWTIHFGWVKGPSRIEGNELVDRLANAAVVEDGPVVYDKIPREVIVTRAKENVRKGTLQKKIAVGGKREIKLLILYGDTE
jgi:ribonuclease HI